MNPAIDLFTEFENFAPYVVNRSIQEDYQANGKAINISFILKEMKIDSVATGFLGGFTGNFIEKELREKFIGTDFIEIDGITRINTFIRSGEKEYKAVNRGPQISQNSQEVLLQKIESLTEKDILFVSGSLPIGVHDNIFVNIAKLSEKRGFQLIWDISSDYLLQCLTYRPSLIKPNEQELAELLNVPELQTEKELVEGASWLVSQGAQRVLVSLGEEGSLYVDKENVLFASAPKGKVVNTACSGDTMLAMFVGKMLQTNDLEEALISATAAGTSTAFSAGLSDLKDVPLLKEQVQLKRSTIKI